LTASTRRSRLGAQSNHDSESDSNKYKGTTCTQLSSYAHAVHPQLRNSTRTPYNTHSLTLTLCPHYNMTRWRTNKANTDLEIGDLTTLHDDACMYSSLHWQSPSTLVTSFFLFSLVRNPGGKKTPQERLKPTSLSQFQPHRRDKRVGTICGYSWAMNSRRFCQHSWESVGFDGPCTFSYLPTLACLTIPLKSYLGRRDGTRCPVSDWPFVPTDEGLLNPRCSHIIPVLCPSL
jgi:hypothetical protein